MSDRLVAAVRECATRIHAGVALERPLTVLVIGDPDGSTCRALGADGYDVACCPDLQRPRTGEYLHASVAVDTVAELIGSDLHVDLIVTAAGWPRVLEANPPARTAALVEWMRQHALVSLVQAPRRVLAPDLNDLGPFRTHEVLGAFRFLAEPVDIVADLDTPLLVASDHVLLAAGEWVAADEVEWIGSEAADAWAKSVRTFRLPGGRIAKVETASEDYFERTQVVGECAFLAEASPDRRRDLGLPAVLDLARGRAVATLVREDVPGDPMGPGLPRRTRLVGLVEAASAYAAAGLFHNDVRPWNVLWHEGTAQLIDFGDCSTVDDDVRDLPQVLALAGSLAAIATDEVRGGEHFHTDVLAIAHASGLLDLWPLAVQLGEPWWNVPRLSARLVESGTHGQDAAAVMRSVLEATVG